MVVLPRTDMVAASGRTTRDTWRRHLEERKAAIGFDGSMPYKLDRDSIFSEIQI